MIIIVQASRGSLLNGWLSGPSHGKPASPLGKVSPFGLDARQASVALCLLTGMVPITLAHSPQNSLSCL